MRKASENNFPYTQGNICYIEIKNNCEPYDVPHHNKGCIDGIAEVYNRVLNNESKLYAVWPGDYSSDLFIIDDLNLFEKAFQIKSHIKFIAKQKEALKKLDEDVGFQEFCRKNKEGIERDRLREEMISNGTY